MTTIDYSRLPRLIVSAGVLACALVALPLAFGSQPDGSPALKVVQALADGDGGGDHDGGDHDGGHDGDHSASAEHGSSGSHDDSSASAEHGSSSGHDGDDDGYDDSSNDRYQNDDRNS
jgi:hypothetical protein